MEDKILIGGHLLREGELRTQCRRDVASFRVLVDNGYPRSRDPRSEVGCQQPDHPTSDHADVIPW